MQESKQLNVKLPSDLYDRIIKTGRSRKDVIIDALDMYFGANEHNQHQEPQQDNDTSNALISQLQEKEADFRASYYVAKCNEPKHDHTTGG